MGTALRSRRTACQADHRILAPCSDMLAGFSQNFGCLPRSAQHSEVADLVQRVHEVRQRQLPHPTQPPATSSAAQQLGSLSLVDSHSANTVHAEEEAHSQDVQQPQQQELDAMRELCALDNVSNDFLLHALMVKGGGSLQVRFQLCSLQAEPSGALMVRLLCSRGAGSRRLAAGG